MKSITFFLFLSIQFTVVAQSSFTIPAKSADQKIENKLVLLEGSIVDHQNQPIEGAYIFIHDIKVSAVSKKNGGFVTPNFTSGKYLVEISHLGFASIIETIDLSNSVQRKFILQESVAEHDAVTVTGVASAIKIKQSAQPVSVLRKSELLEITSTNIIDAIGKKVPGFSALSTGPAISKPVIRGLGYNRVVVINDGIKQEGQQWGDEHGIEIDENSVQKAEVIKGPASLMYGSDALAGVLNLITNVPVEQKTIKGNLGYHFLDNNGMHNASANVAGHLKSGFNFNVYGTYKSAKDYENKYDGKVFNSRFNEQNIGGYIGLNKAWGYTHLLMSSFNQKTGLVEGERDAITGKFLVFAGTMDEREATNTELNSRDLFTPYQHIQHFKIASDNSFNLKKGRLTLNLAYQKNKRLEFGDYLAPTTPELYFDLSTISYNLQYHFPVKRGWKTAIGVNGMQQQNLNKATEVLIPEYNQFDAGIFVFSKKTIHQFSLSGGLRIDYRKLNTKEYYEGTELKFSNLNKQFSNFSGSLGFAYEANKNVVFKFNVARGYRAPSVAEIASNGIHEGTNRYEFGNKNLKTESSFQIDAGLEFDNEHFSFNTSVFYNNIHNYIFYRKLESVNGGDSMVATPNGDAMAFKFSQSNATLYGFEAKFDVHPHPLDWLHFENTFSLVMGRFATDIQGNNKIPFIPAPRWQSELRADFKQLGKHLSNTYFKIEMDKVSTQNNIFSTYNTETITNGYTLLNIGAGTNFKVKSKKIFSIYLALNNATNVAYQNHLSRLKYTAENVVTNRMGVFNMGRNFSAKIIVPFNFSVK